MHKKSAGGSMPAPGGRWQSRITIYLVVWLVLGFLSSAPAKSRPFHPDFPPSSDG